jgi:hypothetical protein
MVRHGIPRSQYVAQQHRNDIYGNMRLLLPVFLGKGTACKRLPVIPCSDRHWPAKSQEQDTRNKGHRTIWLQGRQPAAIDILRDYGRGNNHHKSNGILFRLVYAWGDYSTEENSPV